MTTTEEHRATIAIYNFQHGISSGRGVRFGPYVIRVERAEHFDPSIFASSGGRYFSSTVDHDNDQLVHVTTPLPARPGLWGETAVVEDEPALHAGSVLFPRLPFLSGKDDLALILWFLTGREVAVGSDRPQRFMLRAAERVVSTNYFDFPTIDWSKLPLLASTGASDSLYAVCLGLASPDALLSISVTSGALDSLVSRWYKDNRAHTTSDEVRARFAVALDSYRASLLELGESPERIEDVLARIPNLLNDASALAKLRAFLTANKMLDPEAGEAAQERVKLLNTYRNAVAHRASLLVNSKAPIETQLQVAGVVSLILPMICRVYIAKHLLGVVDDTYGLEMEEANVRSFFSTGRFRGQDVFNESYDDFIRRVDEAWTQHGEFPVDDPPDGASLLPVNARSGGPGIGPTA